MRPKLVICIPTYNRSSVISQVLDHEAGMLKENGIDIIIYDSSENRETENIFETYKNKGFDNLFLKKVDSRIPSNRKIYMIWQDMEKSEYDYIWLIHDHRICTHVAVSHILQALEENKDFYILNTSGKGRAASTEISTLNVFFREGASLLTLYGASIINRRTFLSGTHWKRLERRYLKGRDINFSQLGFYYERASQISGFKASLLEFPADAFIYIPLKEQGGFGWYNDAVRIWTKCWAATILKLPVCYKGKMELIRSTEKIHLSGRKLTAYQKDGVFDLACFFKYVIWIKVASSESMLQHFFSAAGRPGRALRVHNRTFIKKIKRMRKAHKNIVIFGAGKYARLCGELLGNNQVEFDAFVVTVKEKNPEELMRHPVLPAAEYFGGKTDLIVIIATASDKTQKEIWEYIKSLNSSIDVVSFENW
jgi:glycosyltransferase involved in cell wall biosynthesis